MMDSIIPANSLPRHQQKKFDSDSRPAENLQDDIFFAEWVRLERLGFASAAYIRSIWQIPPCRYQRYADVESYRRMHFELPITLVNYDFGWPVIVSDDEGNPIRQPFCSRCDATLTRERKLQQRLLEELIHDKYIGPVERRNSPIHSDGVFTTAAMRRESFIGCYTGTVMTDEEWESEKSDSDYCVIVNSGANGVVIDGECGAVTVLKHMNHSCDPNCTIRFQFIDGLWHALVQTIRDVGAVCFLPRLLQQIFRSLLDRLLKNCHFHPE